MIIFSPVVRLIQIIAHQTLRLLGIKLEENQRVLSPQDEIRGAIDLQAHEGGIVKEHKDMLAGILDLDEISLEDVMVHRRNVETINVNDSIANIFQQIISSPYTRLPMWEKDQDNIIGVIHAKDVLRITRKDDEALNHQTLRNIALSPWFVPETTSLRDQLKMFLAKKSHFAIVVEEYGALMGVITLEDILEEIVGDFTTNTADNDDEVIARDNGSYLIDGAATIREINKATGWDLPTNGPKTLNGIVFEQLESIPDGNVSFVVAGYRFETEEINGTMVKKVCVSCMKKPKQPDE